jgi:hypothetical protein
MDEPIVKDDQTKLIDVNVALTLAENTLLKGTVAEKDAQIEDLSKKLTQALDLIAEQTKSKLLAEIKGKTTIPSQLLSLKSVDELSKMKEILDTASVPAFKAGTPLSTKEMPRMKLDSMFGDFMKKIGGAK